MEEDNRTKRRRIFNLIYKILSCFVLSVLLLIGGFLIFYVINTKLAEKKGTTPLFGLYTIISPSMTPNINVYDVVLIKRTDTSKLKVNDVITFYSTNSFFGTTPITHRIVEVINNNGEILFRVKGDANQVADDEKVLPSNVVGKVLFKIPQLGKLQFFLASKGGWIIAIMIPALAIIAYDIYKIFKLLMLKSKLVEIENKNGNI